MDYFDSNELKIIFVSALEEIQSKDIHLLLITKNGLRIFLSFNTITYTFVEPYLSKFVNLDRPTENFQIIFVKWPIILPNKKNVGHMGLLMDKRSTIASTQQSRKMINGFLDKNTCLMIESNDHMTINDDISFKTVYFYSLNPSKLAVTGDLDNNKRLMENAGVIKLSTDYYYEDLEICKIPEKSLVNSTVSQLLDLRRNGPLINKEFLLSGKTGSFSFNCLNDLSRQVYLPAAHYIFLTSESLDFVLKARPIDILFQILSITHNENLIDEYEFNKFVVNFGGIETCCMLLEIICNADMIYYFNESLDKKLKEDYFIRIKQNFIKEKAAPVDNKQNIKCTKSSEDVINKAVVAFFKLGDSVPEVKQETGERRDFFEAYGRVLQPEQKKYTFKIEGFLLYFSRLIRPVWNKKIVEKSVFECLIYDRLENFMEDELHLVRKRILEIKNFMDSKNDRLLIRNNYSVEEMIKSEKNNVLEFSSAYKKKNNENGAPFGNNQEGLPINQKKGNVEDIIWDEKVLDYFFYEYLFFLFRFFLCNNWSHNYVFLNNLTIFLIRF